MEHRPTTTPVPAEPFRRREAGAISAGELAQLSRRLLTLAATGVSAGETPWVWRSVEAIALRLLQAAGDAPFSDDPG